MPTEYVRLSLLSSSNLSPIISYNQFAALSCIVEKEDSFHVADR